jgi:hypothetical protein
MKQLHLLILAAIAAFLFFNSCDLSDTDIAPFTITGQVENIDTNNAINEALVEIIQPTDLAQEAVTNTSGQYVFEEVLVDSVVDVTIQASRQGFNTSTIEVVAVPGRDLTVPVIRLRSTASSGGGGGDDSGGSVPGASAGAAAIVLQSISATSINIAETGGNVNSAFTFEVQDSSGRALSSAGAVDVEFFITEGPGGGEAITPEVVNTGTNGRATSNIFAGNAAGNVKIEARVYRADIDLEIRSKPILLAIHGGFPDLDHFSIAAGVFNFEALAVNGNRNPITVILGDKFSNPVKPETPVYFNTTGGIIQGSGQTNDDGEIVVDLISGNPRPVGGYATVRAHTFDEDDQPIEQEIQVLFSGPPSNSNITVTPSTFAIGPNGSESFEMTITDENGNPLPYNTSITVEPAEGMAVEGDVNVNVPNTLFGGPGVTEFTFTARDTDEENDDVQDVSIVIKVMTPNGFSATKTLTGTKAKIAP